MVGTKHIFNYLKSSWDIDQISWFVIFFDKLEGIVMYLNVDTYKEYFLLMNF